MIYVYFNNLGAVSEVDASEETLRQGSKGIGLECCFDSVTSNLDYTATFNFTRSDNSKITGINMNPVNYDENVENSESSFRYYFNDEWYFAKAGQTTLTIFLHDSENNIVAQGQVQFNIEETDYDDDPAMIDEEQYNSIQAVLAELTKRSLKPFVIGDTTTVKDVLDEYGTGFIPIVRKRLVLSSFYTYSYYFIKIQSQSIVPFQPHLVTITDFLSTYHCTVDDADNTTIVSLINEMSKVVTELGDYDLKGEITLRNLIFYNNTFAIRNVGNIELPSEEGKLALENNVVKNQANISIIRNFLTNINGKTLSAFTVAYGQTQDHYEYYQILEDGEPLTETRSKDYMEGMTGSRFLPVYDFDKPKVTLFLNASDGVFYKLQYDTTNGLRLFKMSSPLVNKTEFATKVDKTSSANKAYGTDDNGNQITYNVDDYVDGAIVRRDSSGQVQVPITPSQNGHATSKQFVLTKINEAVAGAYKPKGSVASVANLPTTGNHIGDVYNVLDTGANYVWAEIEGVEQWDKLGETINWSEYNETFLASGFIQTSDVDSVPEELEFDDNGDITNDNWTGEITIDYMSPPISDITVSAVPSVLTFDTNQNYDNMITNADWTGIMTITY